MTQSSDYRKYLDERFNAMERDMHAHFSQTHDTLDRIEGQVKLTNHRVTNLEQWKTTVDAVGNYKTKRLSKVLKVASVVVAFVVMIATIYFGYQRTKKDVVNMLDQYSFDMVTRSWTFNKDST